MDTVMHQPDPAHVGAPGPDAQYARSLSDGHWQVQRCNACERPIFFPRTACPACGSTNYRWFTPSGRGVVHSTTVMRRSTAAGGDLHLCLVDLEEGFRMMSRVVDIDPVAVAIGDRVLARLDNEAGSPLVVFRLQEESA